MGKALGGVQTQMARLLKVNIPRGTIDRTWRYTSAAAREAAGFLTMEEYVRRRQNMVSQYIATRSLIDLCEGLKRDHGAQVRMQLRGQEGIELAGAREAAAAVAEEEGGEE